MAKRLISSIVLAALVIVIGAGALWALLPWLVSTDAMQAAVERELGSVFDTPAELGGVVDVTIFPRPRARLTDVTMQAPGGGNRPILTSEVIEAEVGLASLLTGRPDFSTFRLVRPHVQIDQRADGSIGWTQVSGRVGRLLAGRDTQTRQGERLGIVETVQGRLTIYDPAGEIAEDITSIDATIDWAELDAPLSLNTTAIWRGTSGTLSLTIGEPPAFFTGQPAQTRLSFQSEIAQLQFDGQASLGATNFADGTMEFSTPSARALLALLQAPLIPGRVLGAVDLSGPILLAQRRARFEALNISVDGNAGTGVLDIVLGNSDSQPAVTGTLDFQSLDVVQFLRAFIEVPQGPQDDNSMAIGFANLPDADLRISATNAGFGHLDFVNLAATAQVTREHAIFDIGDAEAYGGHVQARLQLGAPDAPGRAEMIVSGQGVDTAQLSQALPLPRALPRGSGDFAITIAAPADRWRTMARNAYGTVSITMTEGRMPGLGYTSLTANREAGGYFSIDTDVRGEPFSAMRVNGDVRDGLITLRDSTISYPQGEISLSGIVSHSGGSLALTAVARPTQDDDAAATEDAASSPEPSASFFIGGSWNRPFATPMSLALPLGLPAEIID